MKVSIMGGGIGSTAGRCHRAALTLDGKNNIDSGVFSKDNKKNILSYLG